MRFFNTAGPVDSSRHYCLDPLGRFDLEEILMLIEQQKYFVLHAPRQTGKTSSMLALMEYLNQRDKYRCLYVNMEAGQAARNDLQIGMRGILGALGRRIGFFDPQSNLSKDWSQILDEYGPTGAFAEFLARWSGASDKPAVLLIDEIDALVGDILISVLRQIRAGYPDRPEHFPQSIVLCGVRDVRDYRIHTADNEIIAGGSAFNIKAKSLRLGDFSREDIVTLYVQHTEETGQEFTDEALELVWHYTAGQPWLVNALAYECCFETKEGRDRTRPISKESIELAKESLIVQRVTHLDQLADKLREERVRRVIEPLISGELPMYTVSEDDLDYVTDLGLIHRKPQVKIANPIYKEIIPRMLTSTLQDGLPFNSPWYTREDRSLDMAKLLTAFQEFFRENSEIWLERFDYKEAGPQLLMQAFMQRIINGGGRIAREYGIGLMRIDLLVLWPLTALDSGVSETERWMGKIQKAVIELKILHKSLERTIADGLKQTASYMDKCAADDGHLIIFDRRPGKSWDEKIFRRDERFEGRKIVVWGM